MNLIRIPVSLSPHIVNGKPRGYYILAQRLFTNGTPVINKQQFVGHNDDGLIVTVGRGTKAQNLFGMTKFYPILDGKWTVWLAECSLFPMRMGFRGYIPSHVLKPSAVGQKVETTGIFRQDKQSGIYYLEIPKITDAILLGKDKLI